MGQRVLSQLPLQVLRVYHLAQRTLPIARFVPPRFAPQAAHVPQHHPQRLKVQIARIESARKGLHGGVFQHGEPLSLVLNGQLLPRALPSEFF